MKIAIPMDEKRIEANVSESFGRAPYILIYDQETSESLFFDNVASKSRGGAGIKAAQMVIDKGADVLLAPRLGQNAADVLKSADVRVYKTIDGSAKENVEAFVAEKLSLLDDIHAGYHNHDAGGH
ncbi:MAG: NifB/NifX family molybdenum-iron cluster-binding protein [Saccharofermentanales bacterium]|jgi:predicted Fe-Mo cluster-binding NifX family protein|nr:dinitrogenase iron-molybdenum cofactor biosynthesis protein [Clostridiaceae bacterium]